MSALIKGMVTVAAVLVAAAAGLWAGQNGHDQASDRLPRRR